MASVSILRKKSSAVMLLPYTFRYGSASASYLNQPSAQSLSVRSSLSAPKHPELLLLPLLPLQLLEEDDERAGKIGEELLLLLARDGDDDKTVEPKDDDELAADEELRLMLVPGSKNDATFSR